MTHILSKKYIILKKIGQGSFGKIYYAKRISNGTFVVIKVEKRSVKERSLLSRELKVYNKLNNGYRLKLPDSYYSHNISKVYDFFTDMGKTHNVQYMVMEHTGKNLQQVLVSCGGKLPILNVYFMAVQMINLIEQVHNIGWLHRDIKPENFTLKNRVIYLIDFGLSRKWEELVDRYDSLMVSGQSASSIDGTMRYMSINIHEGKSYSWRDDLESLGYVLIYFYKGCLPWQGRQKSRDLRKEVYKMKQKKDLLLKDLPKTLRIYMKYCYKLKIDTIPNYNNLRNHFINGISKLRTGT